MAGSEMGYCSHKLPLQAAKVPLWGCQCASLSCWWGAAETGVRLFLVRRQRLGGGRTGMFQAVERCFFYFLAFLYIYDNQCDWTK